ncbi:MAG: MFS transporter, partial [Candidatus Dormibacteraceae bacterium]
MSASLYRAFGGAPRGRALAALRHRNFRSYMPGQALSMVGTAMLGVSIAWLVYVRTGSALWVGIAITLQYLPLAAGRPFARLLLSTVSQRRLLLGTQTLFCCIAAALLLVVGIQEERVKVWSLLLFSLLWGAVQATDTPVRQAFLVDLVGRRDLTYAMSLVASIWNLASLAGAAAAGLLLFWGAPWTCFLGVLVATLAGVASLLLISDPPVVVAGDRTWPATPPWRSLLGRGWSGPVVGLIVIGCAFSALGMNRLTLLPSLFAGRLDSGALGFGVGVAAVGAGAALAAAALLWLGRPAIRHSLLWPGLCWALVTALVGWSAWWPLTLLALMVTGATQTWLLAVVAQRLFEAVGDRDRGPVMTLYARCAIATNCVGPLQAGILASALDVRLTLTVDAALLVAVTLAVGIGFRSHPLS